MGASLPPDSLPPRPRSRPSRRHETKRVTDDGSDEHGQQHRRRRGARRDRHERGRRRRRGGLGGRSRPGERLWGWIFMIPAVAFLVRLPDRADPARALRQLHEVERAGRAVLRSGRAGRPRQLPRAAARGRLDPQELRVLGAQQLLLRALRRSDPDRPRAVPRADRQPEAAARQGLLPNRVLHAVGVELDRHRVHLPVPVPTRRCDQHDPVGLRRRRSAVVQQRRGDASTRSPGSSGSTRRRPSSPTTGSWGWTGGIG